MLHDAPRPEGTFRRRIPDRGRGVWRVRDGITNVAIKIGENPAPPFVDCRTDAGICRIDCEHRLCFSGSINPLLAVPPSRYFDYDFASSTAQASSDPGIRIDP